MTNTFKISYLSLALSLCLASTSTFAGSREQAKQIHDRIAGVPPTEAVLLQMADLIDDGNVAAAAEIAMEHEGFYSATLKRMATPWTNRDLNPFEDLNDYVATFIGIVRDERDFRELLHGDVLYTVSGVTPAYSNTSNQHYINAEQNGVSLKDNLAFNVQSAITGLPSNATAGVMTTRAGARAFFYAGTNRAMFRFTLMSQLCRDLEQLEDTSGVPDRIRQDVSRSPGGDSRLFVDGCVGCHIGMDPMAQAFAYYNYVDADSDIVDTDNGQLVYNTAPVMNEELGEETRVQPKYHINAATFPYGFITRDDSWDNYWREGPNAILGWNYGGGSPTGSGNGAKTMGLELANSRAFAQCQVEKVFRTVCLREPEDDTDQDEVLDITDNFVLGGYNLKQVFAQTAEHCMGP